MNDFHHGWSSLFRVLHAENAGDRARRISDGSNFPGDTNYDGCGLSSRFWLAAVHRGWRGRFPARVPQHRGGAGPRPSYRTREVEQLIIAEGRNSQFGRQLPFPAQASRPSRLQQQRK